MGCTPVSCHRNSVTVIQSPDQARDRLVGNGQDVVPEREVSLAPAEPEPGGREAAPSGRAAGPVIPLVHAPDDPGNYGDTLHIARVHSRAALLAVSMS
jgi:hypothetical protein